jgi:outer membrane receptor protein involved in Fe transport
MKRILLISALLAARAAHAQDIEVPILVMENQETEAGTDTELDLANLVQSATKGQTTVQEAPAIITIITADELRDRNTRNLEDAIDRIPGWLRGTAEYGQFPQLLSRGNLQAMLLLRDGVSMFDELVNIATVSRVQPLETIKRIEVVTGPGGVLWGANSFLGIVNVITKDAEDVHGVEASVGYGDGPGDESAFRGYVMVGLPKLLGGKLKLFAHASFESYDGPVYTIAAHMYSDPAPNPNSPFIYGPITNTDAGRSMIFNFDGKLTAGSTTVYWSVPIVSRLFGLGFPGNVVRQKLPEDTATDPTTGMPLCPQVSPNDPNAGTPTDNCIDRGRVSRKDELNFFERYGIIEQKTRFSAKADLTIKGYFIQFVRDFVALQILMPVPTLLEGGLSFSTNATNYRTGASADGSVELGSSLRLLYGGEAFHEWLPDNTSLSRQGAGAESTFLGPYDLTRLPLKCPHTATFDPTTMTLSNVQLIPGCPTTFAFSENRTVMGLFADLQWRPPVKGLIFDGGVRVQAAPSFLSSRSYALTPVAQGSAVYEFIPNWHLKLNFTQGFRAPVFNDTDSNVQSVQLAGNPNLLVEHSTAFQTEVNARLLKGQKRVRELDVRADYSYSLLDNFIQVANATYVNGGQRGISSAELLAKLYLKGDHRIELGYTWMQGVSADKGDLLYMPENWFNFGGVLSVVPKHFELNANLRILGAFEDPNRRVQASNLSYDQFGHASASDPTQTVFVTAAETVMDRIPPGGELQLGVRYVGMNNHLQIAAETFNTFNAANYQPDAFADYQPRLEIQPIPYEKFRFFASATYAY